MKTRENKSGNLQALKKRGLMFTEVSVKTNSKRLKYYTAKLLNVI